MSEADLFLDFVRRFEALQLEYMLTGSVAATMYGEPRVTHDVDVVLSSPESASGPSRRPFRSRRTTARRRRHCCRRSSGGSVGTST